MSKMDQMILCIPSIEVKEELTKTINQGSFLEFSKKNDYHSILEKAQVLRRGDLEEDPKFKQVIPYGVINYENNYLYFVRASGGGETRLHQKMAIGFGGHIEIEDIDSAEDTIEVALKREIMEETGITGFKNIDAIGYIYTEQSQVDQVHLGILFEIEVSQPDLNLQPDEIREANFVSSEELDMIINSDDYDVENWTKICWKYLSSIKNN